MKSKVVILTGPTAVGKTDIAIAVATELSTEIISADSRQIYKYMDIGTAKPTKEQQKKVKHHLIDIRYPDEIYTIADYKKDVGACIKKFFSEGKIPFIVGGTALYLMTVKEGWPFDGLDTDPYVRKQLEKELKEKGVKALYQRLMKVDSETAKRIHPNDSYRIKRALEVFLSSGRSIFSWQKETHGEDYDILFLGLIREREELYRRIELRVDVMFRSGFVEEVRNLLSMGYSEELPSMNGIGYREVCIYLKTKAELDKVISLTKQRTRNFAKRQLTWFRKISGIIWYNLSCKNEDFVVKEIVRSIREFYGA